MGFKIQNFGKFFKKIWCTYSNRHETELFRNRRRSYFSRIKFQSHWNPRPNYYRYKSIKQIKTFFFFLCLLHVFDIVKSSFWGQYSTGTSVELMMDNQTAVWTAAVRRKRSFKLFVCSFPVIQVAYLYIYIRLLLWCASDTPKNIGIPQNALGSTHKFGLDPSLLSKRDPLGGAEEKSKTPPEFP